MAGQDRLEFAFLNLGQKFVGHRRYEMMSTLRPAETRLNAEKRCLNRYDQFHDDFSGSKSRLRTIAGLVSAIK